MRVWWDMHSASAACILILSLSNIDVLFVLFSGAFGEHELFMMPISKLSKNAVHYYGLPQHFLEDVPQLVLQLVSFRSSCTTAHTHTHTKRRGDLIS